MTLEFEKSNMMEFAELPFHYIEIATLLFASYVAPCAPRCGVGLQ